MIGYYVLDADHHVVAEPNQRRWERWIETDSNRRVGYTRINAALEVSTVFLGLDHWFSNDGQPRLFETVIFGGSEAISERMWRYSSWDDAVIGHEAAVRLAASTQH